MRMLVVCQYGDLRQPQWHSSRHGSEHPATTVIEWRERSWRSDSAVVDHRAATSGVSRGAAGAALGSADTNRSSGGWLAEWMPADDHA